MTEPTDSSKSQISTTATENTTPDPLFPIENDEEKEEDATPTQDGSEQIILDEMAELKLKEEEEALTDEEKHQRKVDAERVKEEGNTHFREKDFEAALQNYSAALAICPFVFPETRAILFSNRGTAKLKLSDTSGAIEDFTKAIELQPTYVKALLRRAQSYEQTDKLDEALADYEKGLAEQPNNEEALKAVQSLKPRIAERNEKLKTEMMGKLKDLGNLILRPFGLSTSNFNMVQDPTSGSYSVNFQK